MSAANSNTNIQAGAEDSAFEQLRRNDGFQDMVVRAAEQMVLDAPLDDLVNGSWPEAQAAWGRLQRSRFRRPRRARSRRAA